jgi:hypothetical protein
LGAQGEGRLCRSRDVAERSAVPINPVCSGARLGSRLARRNDSVQPASKAAGEMRVVNFVRDQTTDVE